MVVVHHPLQPVESSLSCWLA